MENLTHAQTVDTTPSLPNSKRTAWGQGYLTSSISQAVWRGRRKKRNGTHCLRMHQSVLKILVHCIIVHNCSIYNYVSCNRCIHITCTFTIMYTRTRSLNYISTLDVEHMAVRVYWYVYKRNTEILDACADRVYQVIFLSSPHKRPWTRPI